MPADSDGNRYLEILRSGEDLLRYYNGYDFDIKIKQVAYVLNYFMLDGSKVVVSETDFEYIPENGEIVYYVSGDSLKRIMPYKKTDFVANNGRYELGIDSIYKIVFVTDSEKDELFVDQIHYRFYREKALVKVYSEKVSHTHELIVTVSFREDRSVTTFKSVDYDNTDPLAPSSNGKLKYVWNMAAYKLDKCEDAEIFRDGIEYRLGRTEGKIFWFKDFSGSDDVWFRFNYAEVNISDISGCLDAIEKSYSKFGFLPGIITVPHFSEVTEISHKMIEVAEKIRGVAIIDTPLDTIYTTKYSQEIRELAQIRSRLLPTSSERVLFTIPNVRTGRRNFYIPYEKRTADFGFEERALSPYIAGVMAEKDRTRGFWWSPSASEIKGITGLSYDLSAKINDENCDVNILNDQGIVTVFNGAGTGFMVWGNRSASYPASTAPTNFINVRRTADIIYESVEHAMLDFIDRPLNNALIDAIAEKVNDFLRDLMDKGALVDAKCWFDPAKNEPVQIAKGQVRFDIEFMPPTPAEMIFLECAVDMDKLRII